MSAPETRLSTLEREFLAVLFACERFRCYLYLRHFTLYVDHSPLQILQNSANMKNAKLLRWKLRLSEYQFTVVHRPGRKHLLADALSRMEERIEGSPEDPDSIELPPNLEAMLPEPPAFWGETDSDWLEWQHSDPACEEFRKTANQPGSCIKEIDGILYHVKDSEVRIVVPRAKRQAILEALHDHVLAGHMGAKATLKKVQEKFWWPVMKQTVDEYVKTCENCQRAKRPIRRQPGLMRPIPPPVEVGEFLCIDLAGPLPLTDRKNRHIVLAIDLLTKFVYAKAIPDASAEQVVQFFNENIIAVQGPPRYLLSDNGSCFLAYKTQNFLRSQGCKLINSSPMHPNSHGIVERQFSTLKAALRAYLQDTSQSLWDVFLPTLVYAMNSTYKEAIRTTPYELVFSQKPRYPFEVKLPRLARLKDPDRARQAALMREQARLAILRAQKIYEKRGNLKRVPVYYEPGDLVLLDKVVAPIGLNEKLYCKWRGPFLIVDVPSANTVRIAPPDDLSKAQIVHVERVKRYYSREGSDQGNLKAHSLSKDNDKLSMNSSSPNLSSEDEDEEYSSSERDDNTRPPASSSESSQASGGEQGSDDVEVGSAYESEGEERRGENIEPLQPNQANRSIGRGRGSSPYTTRAGRATGPPDRYQAGS